MYQIYTSTGYLKIFWLSLTLSGEDFGSPQSESLTNPANPRNIRPPNEKSTSLHINLYGIGLYRNRLSHMYTGSKTSSANVKMYMALIK